jgi:hypothetical protein
MGKPFRKILDPLLAKTGYRLSRLEPKGYPVEFDARDKEIVSYVSVNNLSMTSFERLYGTLMACRHVCEFGIEGDFVECGVWRGGNALIAADVFSRFAPGRKTYLFDTFAGMTEPTDADVSGGVKAKERYLQSLKDDYSDWCYASLDEVKAGFQARGLLSQAVFVRGDVLKTLKNAENLAESISVLRLDTDWYESTKMELEILYPRLQIGGVLIVDDYGYWGGAKKAVDEYFMKYPKPFLQYVDHTGRMGVKLR